MIVMQKFQEAVLPPLEAQGFDKSGMRRDSHACLESGVL